MPMINTIAAANALGINDPNFSRKGERKLFSAIVFIFEG